MKNTKMMRVLLAFLSLFCMLSLLSCGQAAKATEATSKASGSADERAAEKEGFSFVFPEPASEVSCGETVSYAVYLVNNTGSKCTVTHAMPMMGVYVYPAGQKPENWIYVPEITTHMEAGERIDKSVQITFDEAGEYKVRAFCDFFIGEEEYRYTREYSVHVS